MDISLGSWLVGWGWVHGAPNKEMSDGRHAMFDGHVLRWSDGKIWRRVEEQSGMHQAPS